MRNLSGVVFRGVLSGFIAGVAMGALGTQLSSDFVPTFRVDNPTTFTITNVGTTDFVFTWVDQGVTNSVRDPDLVLSSGVQYVFVRSSSSHPFGILSGEMPVATNFDFSLRRDSSSPNTYLLANGGQLSGNPASQPNSVTWTPTGAGDYFYTCMVTSHANMTGRFVVVDKPVATTPMIADFVIIDEFAALLVTNVVKDQVLVVQYSDSLTEATFETTDAFLVESDIQELFIPGLTNSSGFIRTYVD